MNIFESVFFKSEDDDLDDDDVNDESGGAER